MQNPRNDMADPHDRARTRIAALQETGLLDTPPESACARITTGWSGASLAREYELMEEEIASVLGTRAHGGSDGGARRSVAELLGRAHQGARAALRREGGA